MAARRQVSENSQVRPGKRKWRPWAAVAAAVVIGAAALWVWEEYLEDRWIPKRWGTVEPGSIYRSGQLSASLVRRILEKHGIRVLVDLTGGAAGGPDQKAELEACAALGIERLEVSLQGDGTGDIEHYARALERVHRAVQENQPVLVHCAAGAQRTGAAIALYRMLIQKKPPAFAYEELQEYDWDPDDDRVLQDYVNEHIAELARLLIEMKVLERAPDPLPFLGP